MARADHLQEFEDSFTTIAIALFAPGSVDLTLRRIVALATETIDGCDAAGVLVWADGVAVTSALSDPVVRELDDVQIAMDEGPCVDAFAGGARVHMEDMADDRRWPSFGPAALQRGMRSVLAYPLSEDRLSVLGLWARLPGAFGVTDRAQGQLFSTLAGLALGSADARAADTERAWHLTEAMRTRELIGQAQGILMERERITADQAFDILRRASQHVNMKLRTVAEALVETGESPDIGRTDRGVSRTD